MSVGFATSFSLPEGCCWYGCGQPREKGSGFCKKHGKVKIKCVVVDNVSDEPQPKSNIGFHKKY